MNQRDLSPRDHDDRAEGLAADLVRMAQLERRRRALRTLAGFGTLAALPTIGLAKAVSSCTAIESETSGPYPADGTNSNSSGTVNVLTESGIVRSDIRSSFGSMTGTAAGVPMTVTLQLVGVAASCASLAGYAIYLWHCDRDGEYSLYGVPARNYLRGLQETDSLGRVSFKTIFPACYSGRWPHMHFEVYSSLAVATQGTNSLKTSQIALPKAACDKVYAKASGYTNSAANLAKVSIATDLVFSDDDAAYEMPTISGSHATGYTASLLVGI